MTGVGRTETSTDLLARLTMFYLDACPPRRGLLQRELARLYTLPGDDERAARTAAARRLGEQQWRAERSRARAECLDLAGGNEQLLVSRVADAVWFDSTSRTDPQVEVHELKVSTSDLRAELRKPEKAMAWMQAAHRFWLSVPNERVIGRLQLPEEWGVLVLPYGGLPYVMQEAPLLAPTVIRRGPTRVDYWTVAAAGKTSADGILKHEWRQRYSPRPAAVLAERERRRRTAATTR